jgi:hypothetical protein
MKKNELNQMEMERKETNQINKSRTLNHKDNDKEKCMH